MPELLSLTDLDSSAALPLLNSLSPAIDRSSNIPAGSLATSPLEFSGKTLMNNSGVIPLNDSFQDAVTSSAAKMPTNDQEVFNSADITGVTSGNSGDQLLAPTSNLSSVVAGTNDKSLLFSPYNWLPVNNGLQTSNAGAYLKFKFNGSQAVLNVDTSNQAYFPVLDVFVDGKQTASQQQLWLKNAPNGQVKLFAGGTGDHDVVVYFRRREIFTLSDPQVVKTKQQDWLTDAEHLRITGVQVTGGTGFLTNNFARSKTAVFFGDSITEGGTQYFAPNAPDQPANFPGNPSNNRSYKTYAAVLGDLLKVDYGQIGWSGSGWLKPTTPTGNPPILDSWLRYNGKSSVQRDFANQPDYVFINLGTNDKKFDVTDTAYSWLKQARQKIPGADIFVIHPFNQSKNAQLASAIARYQSENPGDRKVHALNLGAEGAKGLGATYLPQYSPDRLHPTSQRHQQLAGLLYEQLKPILGISTATINSNNFNSGTGVNTVKYAGAWRSNSVAGNTHYFSNSLNSTYEITFWGNNIQLFGNKANNEGIAGISIDGGGESATDLYSLNPINDTLLYRSGDLGVGFHTIKVRVTGQRNANSTGTSIDFGRLEVK
jgi:lysophospholipase L1-like esterase